MKIRKLAISNAVQPVLTSGYRVHVINNIRQSKHGFTMIKAIYGNVCFSDRLHKYKYHPCQNECTFSGNNSVIFILPSFLNTGYSLRKEFAPLGANSFLQGNPAGTRRKNDVVLTSMRRDDVASTSIQRHFVTKCPLGNPF